MDELESRDHRSVATGLTLGAAAAFLGASFLVAGGEAFFGISFLSDFLSFTGPEAPAQHRHG